MNVSLTRYWICKKHEILAFFIQYEWSSEVQYLKEETFFWSENYRLFYLLVDLSVDKISSWNSIILFADEHYAL